MSPYHVPRSGVQRWKLSLNMYVHSNAHTNIKYMSSIYSHGKHLLKDHIFLENAFVLHCIHHSFFPDISSWAPSPSTSHKAKEPGYIQRKLKSQTWSLVFPAVLWQTQIICTKWSIYVYIYIHNGNPWEMINRILKKVMHLQYTHLFLLPFFVLSCHGPRHELGSFLLFADAAGCLCGNQLGSFGEALQGVIRWGYEVRPAFQR